MFMVDLAVMLLQISEFLLLPIAMLGKLWKWVEVWIKNAIETFISMPGRMRTRLIAAFKDLAVNLYKTLKGIFSFTIPGLTIAGVTLFGDTPIDLLPPIPFLAEGGIVTRPTLAMIGEKGPEAVVPLGKGGMGHTFNINIDVSGVTDRSDRRVLAMQISDEIQREMRRWGRGTTRRAV